jgi:hypothetical protein
MKASFTFDFDNLEDINDHRRHTKALDLALCLNEFENMLCAKIKYNEEPSQSDLTLKYIHKILQECKEAYGIDLDILLT